MINARGLLDDAGMETTYGTSINDAVDFCHKEIALLARKNGSEKKPSKIQEQNAVYKELIVDYLTTRTDSVTCTDIQKNVQEFADFNNQKIAALVRQLVESGKVNKETIKGRSFFSIA